MAFKQISLVLMIGGVFLLGCCKTSPEAPLPLDVPDTWSTPLDTSLSEAPPENFTWWKSLNDPTLDWLLETAWEQNLDLHIAMTRVLTARREWEGLKGKRYPHLDGSLTYGHAQYDRKVLNKLLGIHCPKKNSGTKNVDFFELGFDAEWEIDLFGMREHESNAMLATAESMNYEFSNVWLTLSAEIVRNYVELRGFQQRLNLLERSISIQYEILQMAQGLSSGGFESPIDQLNEETRLQTLMAEKPMMQLSIQKAMNRLAVLLGFFPGDLNDSLSSCGSIPLLSDCLPIGIPSELLRRRPDILKAEREVVAATELHAGAVAALFPRLSLYGFVGEIAALCSGGSLAWAAGPQLLLPIFNSRLLEQDVCLNEIKVQQSLYAYQKTVLDALEEAENAISAFNAHKEKKQLLEKAFCRSQESNALTMQLYDGGFKSYTEALGIKKIHLKTEDDYVQSRLLLLLNYVALYKALGGDCQ